MRELVARIACVAAIALLAALPVAAQSADITTDVDGPDSGITGTIATFSVTYENLGPDDSDNTFVNTYLPFGVPAPIDELTQEQFDALQLSACVFTDDDPPVLVSTTDTPLGNWPLLFLETSHCTSLLFQVQGPDWVTGIPSPIPNLTAGASSTWTMDLDFPPGLPELGEFAVTSPAHLADTWTRGNTTWQLWGDATGTDRFGGGADCDLSPAASCEDLSYCFGDRFWQVDPALETDMVIADDGDLFGDPAYACGALVNAAQMPGKISLAKRGGCNFSDKALYSQQAGAVALLMVNDGRCGTTWPDSDDCVTAMSGGDLSPIIDIPVMLLSVNDGMPIFDEVTGGGPVTAVFGAFDGMVYKIDSTSFQSGVGATDPEASNNDDIHEVQVPIFADGFESGDTTAWSNTVE